MTRFMRREEDEGYEVGRVKVTYITERALKVDVLDGDHVSEEELWVPKSQLHSSSQVDDTTLIDEEGTLVTSRWWAKQRGFVRDAG